MRAFRFHWLILLLLALSSGCAGPPSESKPEARPPSLPAATVVEPHPGEAKPIEIQPVEATPVEIQPAEPASEPASAEGGPPASELERAIQRGDWEKAQSVYEQAGRPVHLLNEAMAQGIYLAERARRAGNPEQAGQAIRGVRSLIRRLVSPERVHEYFIDELYFYLVLADSDLIDQPLEREKAIAEDSLADKVVQRMARRDRLAKEDVIQAPVAVCPIADRYFLIVGFQIFDLEGLFRPEKLFRGTTPGLDQLSEGERIPRMYDVFCKPNNPRIQWVNVSSGGRGISIEAEWDGSRFRLVDLSRIDLAFETYKKVRQHVEAGELEKALEAYMDGFTNRVETDLELATLTLRQGLTVARQRMANGDTAGALQALHAALTLASIPYGLDDVTFLPQDWTDRPRSLEEWKRGRSGRDPLLYREALTEYAGLLVQNQRARDAEPILRALLIFSPDYAPIYLYLGDALWDQGLQEEARDFYRQYRERAPEDAWPERVKVRTP